MVYWYWKKRFCCHIEFEPFQLYVVLQPNIRCNRQAVLIVKEHVIMHYKFSVPVTTPVQHTIADHTVSVERHGLEARVLHRLQYL